jgi:ribonuclease P protein component
VAFGGTPVWAQRSMNRRFRLTSTTDFKRVRRSGKSYAHPLVILIAGRNHLDRSRFGVTTTRALDSAVTRNKAKRRLRETLRPVLDLVEPGWDCLWIARPALPEANWSSLQTAVQELLDRSGVTTR